LEFGDVGLSGGRKTGGTQYMALRMLKICQKCMIRNDWMTCR